MKALQKPVDLSRSQLLSILFLICAAAVAHVSRISIEVSLFAGALVLLRLIRLHKTQQLPGRFLISLLTFTAVVVVIYSQPRLASLSTGIAFLVILSALKLWELRQRLDLYLLSFLGYYLVITQFLFNQELWFGALMFAIALGLTAFLYSIHFVRTPGWRQTLRPAFILLLQAMPLAVMMFLLFPRFASPLWSIGLESDFASTGLSTEVSPGSIGQLSRSHAIAFRVKFDDEIPPPNKRYWRAAVFRDTDGFTWHYQPSPLLARLPRVLEAWSHPLGYEIEIEPAPNDWLFALDIPAVIPEHAHLSRAFELVSDKPINKINRYHLSSFTDYALLDLTPAERQRALALPDTITRRMRQLVSQWQAKAATPAEVVHAALDYYRTQPFYYTLTPPLMAGSNPDDEFLFEARQGFCGHYASSFILLMRIAGIPARMVTGYQGGEMNPLGDYMIVRQSSAHAWAEVYLADRGWTRVDPTAAVAPERILQAIDTDASVSGHRIVFRAGDYPFLSSLVRNLGFGMDAMNRNWRTWVIGFSNRKQKNLFDELGLKDFDQQDMGLLMIGIISASLGLLALFMLLRKSPLNDPLLKIHQRFLARLKRLDIKVKASSGPLDLLAAIQLRNKNLATAATPYLRLYMQLRYAQLKYTGKEKQRLLEYYRQFVRNART